jgi:hypothetical protein
MLRLLQDIIPDMFVYDYSPQNVIWSHVDTEKLHTERYDFNCLNTCDLQQLAVAGFATIVQEHILLLAGVQRDMLCLASRTHTPCSMLHLTQHKCLQTNIRCRL